LKSVTMAEACAGAAQDLTGIFPGSWIDANFYIWIGHPDDQRGWNQLGFAREALETAVGADPLTVMRAREEVLIAEGSDWFWWYGDDHSSAHDREFDDLFRRHLRNAYRLLGKPIPDGLFASNITTAGADAGQDDPSAFLTPTLDGEDTSYFEWLGAGAFEVRDGSGAMHHTDRRPSLITLVRFGFDLDQLYVRVDATRRMADLLAEGFQVSLRFQQPEGVRFSVRNANGRPGGSYSVRRLATDAGAGSAEWVGRGAGGARVAAGSVLEIGLPFSDLGVTPGNGLTFFVAVDDAAGAELERHPSHQPIELRVPDERFEAGNWNA
jgi:hypothetical protein